MPRRKPVFDGFRIGGKPNPTSKPERPLSVTFSIRDAKNGDAILSRFIEQVRALEVGKKLRQRANYGTPAPTRAILTQRLQDGFGRWVDSLSLQLDYEISKPQFPWDVIKYTSYLDEFGFEVIYGFAGVYRRNGEHALPPINIVDTGYFLKSKTKTVDLDNLKATFRWDAPYAGYIYFGTSKMPGRDFITPALENTQGFQVFYGQRASNYKPRF